MGTGIFIPSAPPLPAYGYTIDGEVDFEAAPHTSSRVILPAFGGRVDEGVENLENLDALFA